MFSIRTRNECQNLIDQYFIYIKGEYHLENKPVKNAKDDQTEETKVWDRDAEPALLTGLALYLGFNSRQEFEHYEKKGKFSQLMRQARLRVEAEYEKKLHQQAPTGAIFALKSLGWNDKPDSTVSTADAPLCMRIIVIESGPRPAENEKEAEINS